MAEQARATAADATTKGARREFFNLAEKLEAAALAKEQHDPPFDLPHDDGNKRPFR